MNHLEKLSDVACQAQRLTESDQEKLILSKNESSSSEVSSLQSNSSSSGSNSSSNNNNNNGNANVTRSSSSDAIGETDRCSIKEKIKNALRKRSNDNYEDLLELCTSLAEESVYYHAPSRLDYYKSGIQEVKRIFEKAEEIKTSCKRGKVVEQSEEGQKGLKRLKTQH